MPSVSRSSDGSARSHHVVEQQRAVVHLVHRDDVERLVVVDAREVAPRQQQRDDQDRAASRLPTRADTGVRSASRRRSSATSSGASGRQRAEGRHRSGRARRDERADESVLAQRPEAELRVEIGDQRREHHRLVARVAERQRLLQQGPAMAPTAQGGIRAHRVHRADVYAPAHPITSGRSITPTWAIARSPCHRTKGVDTSAQRKPSAAARSAAAGSAGHTRPRSAARRGSSAGGRIAALYRWPP